MPDQFILVGLKVGGLNNYLPKRWIQFYPGLNIDVTDEKLSIRDSRAYIPDFFGKKVSVVSALVGLNGSGKSSTLNYIKQLFIKEKASLRNREDDLILFINENKLYIYLSSDTRNKYEIENDSSFIHEIITYHEYPKLYDKLKNYTAAFYTNGIDFDQKEFETQNYFNLSTGFLLGNFGKVNSMIRSKRVISQSPVKRYQYTEFVRQMNFLNTLEDRPSVKIPFKKFTEVTVTLNEVTRNDYHKLHKKAVKSHEKKDEIGDRFVQEFIRATKSCDYFFENLKKNGTMRDFQSTLVRENLIVMFFDYILEATVAVEQHNRGNLLSDMINMLNDFQQERFLEILKIDMLNSFTQLIKKALSNSSEVEKKMHPIAARIENIKEVLSFTEELFSFADMDADSGRISIQTDRRGFLQVLENFFSLIQCEFIAFKWPKLSAGEEALLAFFSRLDHILQNSKSRNLLLLIDEGDLYFHPEWQRNYLFYILSFINEVGGDFNKMQIILTTHSPFLVSDIPREYHIYLADPTLLELEEHRYDNETFGGNLYALFANNFFLGGSTTSEFARQKIKGEILEPMDKSLNQSSISRITALISKLGDPVVKEILTDRLKERISRR